ncbi:hypothetical protein [Peribacillus frigoritolerans]|uniref:Uncharacterized protein n=1 Tax=Peribacillus castrilensis TaxID=2897690 RepID=A0AAW9NJN1_9BACI|nr:hypothetical protein [Peribacillus castrilensis]MEC0344919.1 hypothetical protein [Peribacillus castrilensis]
MENLKGKVIDEGSTLNSTDNEVSVVASVDNDIDEDRNNVIKIILAIPPPRNPLG